MAEYKIGNENVTVRDRRNSDYWADVNQMYEQAQLDAKLAKYQYDMNLEQWNRENAYNTPSEQMQRLKAAGLNPNLAYDNLSNTAASSPEMQKASASLSHGNYNFNAQQRNLQAVSIANDMRFQSAQIDNLQQANKLMQLQGVNQAIQNNKEMAGSKYWSSGAKYSNDQLRLENERILKDMQEADWRMLEGSANNEAQRKKIYKELDLNDHQISQIEQNIKSMKADVNRQAFLAEITAIKTFSDVDLNDANINKIATETRLMTAQRAKEVATQPLYEVAGNIANTLIEGAKEVGRFGKKLYNQWQTPGYAKPRFGTGFIGYY